jgi:hypothetical protein
MYLLTLIFNAASVIQFCHSSDHIDGGFDINTAAYILKSTRSIFKGSCTGAIDHSICIRGCGHSICNNGYLITIGRCQSNHIMNGPSSEIKLFIDPNSCQSKVGGIAGSEGNNIQERRCFHVLYNLGVEYSFKRDCMFYLDDCHLITGSIERISIAYCGRTHDSNEHYQTNTGNEMCFFHE